MKECHAYFYFGQVLHRRFLPIKHQFRYRVAQIYINVEKTKEVFKYPGIFSLESFGIFSFYRKNYLGSPKTSIKSSVLKLIENHFKNDFHPALEVDVDVYLLTNLSVFGFCFNPVSFYYVIEKETKTLRYVVSEITNTPWGEKKQNVFRIPEEVEDHTRASNRKFKFHFPKDFHVSPFIPMNIDYEWLFSVPEGRIFIHMKNRFKNEIQVMFDAILNLKRKEINGINGIYFFLYSPFVTLKTMVAIYFQAARLYFKGATFYTHPKKVD